jgi:hypothetical protein
MDIDALIRPKDEPFKTGGGGLMGIAMVIAMAAVVFMVFFVLYAGR